MSGKRGSGRQQAISVLAGLFGLVWSVQAFAYQQVDITTAERQPDGVLVHWVGSPYQAGRTAIRVLLPDIREEDRQYPVVYVLPVEAKDEVRYGSGLGEVIKHDLHNKHRAIFIAPTFSQLPWYADHPTIPEGRQETYFTDIVVPFVERTYAASPKSQDRLLLGFSKSGWGAWSLLLRHPQTFGRAVAWDAPLMMDQLGQFGTSDIFGTQANFAAYRLLDLVRDKAELLRTEPRLILTGYGSFQDHHQRMHGLLNHLQIAHEYRDGPQRKHDWHSGWVSQAVELLLERNSRPEEDSQ